MIMMGKSIRQIWVKVLGSLTFGSCPCDYWSDVATTRFGLPLRKNAHVIHREKYKKKKNQLNIFDIFLIFAQKKIVGTRYNRRTR